MNIRALAARKAAGLGRSPPRMTRRRFVGTAAGTAVLGGALGAGLLRPGLAAPKMSSAPVPIPGGSPFLGGSSRICPGLGRSNRCGTNYHYQSQRLCRARVPRRDGDANQHQDRRGAAITVLGLRHAVHAGGFPGYGRPCPSRDIRAGLSGRLSVLRGRRSDP